MKTAWFDCIAGASGDMLLGALLDAGLPLAALEAELAKLHLTDFHLHVAKVSKNGFAATKVDVHVHDHAPERHLREIREIVEKSDVSSGVKERARELTYLATKRVLRVVSARSGDCSGGRIGASLQTRLIPFPA